jgi:hypothetical protein
MSSVYTSAAKAPGITTAGTLAYQYGIIDRSTFDNSALPAPCVFATR